MEVRKHYSGEQKAIILRELLENNTPISQLCEKYNVKPKAIYSWKKKLFESASGIFGQQNSTSKPTSLEKRKIEKLEAKLRDRDEAISYLIRDNISIKKSISGED